MITRIRVKQSGGGGEDAELSLQSGKISVKSELIWKGETSATDRKGEIDIIYEYRVHILLFNAVASKILNRFFCSIFVTERRSS